MYQAKRNKILFIVSLLLSLLFILSACTSASSLKGHRILGVWEHNGSKIEFCDNGYVIKGNEKYAFSVNDKEVTIDNNGEALVLDYSVNSNGTMTMNGLIYYPVSK